ARQKVSAAWGRLSVRCNRSQNLQIVDQDALGHGDIDITALAAALRIEQRSQDAHRWHHSTAENVGDLHIGQDRIPLLTSVLIDKSGVAAIVHIVAGAFTVRAILPIAGYG